MFNYFNSNNDTINLISYNDMILFLLKHSKHVHTFHTILIIKRPGDSVGVS